MSRFEIILLCLCLGACTATPVPQLSPADRATLAAQGYEVIDTPERFSARVVGDRLYGPGYRVEVQPGGVLTGLYVGEPFLCTWEFRDGRYCRSLSPTLSGPTYGCFWVAATASDIRLIPEPAV